jgi:tRNA-uridine 2-sulfurtransferase
MANRTKTVVVGMSGGVDSSVTALILKQQGFHVIGMFMKNWEENDENGVCKSSIEYEDVMKVCEQIDIPYYSVNFVKEYQEKVFNHFLDEFGQGHTPNPDILCNREIKFKVLLEKALEMGADYLATGHYCQNSYPSEEIQLKKGRDLSKDQSYFLYTIKSEILKKVMFPIGGMLKSELRRFAKEHHLATSEKKDSTGVCFIGERNFKEFLGQYLGRIPGNFESLSGQVLGRHDGVAYYTPGQRKGLGIGGAGDAWYVVGKDIERNVVLIDQGSMHPALFCDELTAVELTWVSSKPPTSFPFVCKSKVRYRQPDQECAITKIENGKAHVQFKIPQRAVTSRQSIVFYDNEICLGGGIIESPGPSYYQMRRLLPEIVSP